MLELWNICLQQFSIKDHFFYKQNLKWKSRADHYVMPQTFHTSVEAQGDTDLALSNKLLIKAVPFHSQWTFLEVVCGKKDISDRPLTTDIVFLIQL